MLYGFLADAVVCFHFLWIVFLILGGWWGRRNRVVGAVHLGGLALALCVETFDWYCPLTHLELWLRKRGLQAGYGESFLSHYLNGFIYLEVSHPLIVSLTLALCALNVWLYLSRRATKPSGP